MEPAVLIAVGFVVVFVLVGVPRLQDRYEEKYDDEREFFREQRPRMWGLIGGMSSSDEAIDGGREVDPGRCPACETGNGANYTYCRNCGRLLPTQDE